MSTDQYPEVSSDDSALVPQNTPRPEWPKKIRTLSAAELDRLTIDDDGRFYWDGHPVNYQPPQAPAPETRPGQPVDLDALALLDRASRELSHPAPDDTTTTGEPTSHIAPEHQADEVRPTEPTVVAVAPITPAAAVAPAAHVPQVAPMPIYDMAPRFTTDKIRFRMSLWQTVALWVAIVALFLGAVGMAISGLVAAHEWGCRTEMVKQYCPAPPPAPAPPARVDIPA